MIVAATLLFTSMLAAEPGAAVVIGTLDGQSLSGQLATWSEGQLTLQHDTGQQVIDQRDVLSMRFPDAAEPAADPPCVVELGDESVLPVEQVTVTGRRASLEFDGRFRSSGKMSVPVGAISAIRLGSLTEEAASDWKEVRALEVPADMLVVRKGSPVRLDHLEGVIGDIDEQHVHFELDGESIPVKREKVAGVIYLRTADSELQPAVCVVHGDSALRVNAAQVVLDGDRLRTTSRSGVQLEIVLPAVRWIDFSAGKLVYLSDLRPLSVDWAPLVGLPAGARLAQEAGQPRTDLSFFGSQLSLSFPADGESTARRRVQTYNKGMALRSGTTLTYSVPEDLERFAAVAGIDPQVREQGHVRLVIEGDGNTLLDAEIAGTDDPLSIDVPVSGVRRLTLRVDYGDNWDLGDLLHLCDAKFTK